MVRWMKALDRGDRPGELRKSSSCGRTEMLLSAVWTRRSLKRQAAPLSKGWTPQSQASQAESLGPSMASERRGLFRSQLPKKSSCWGALPLTLLEVEPVYSIYMKDRAASLNDLGTRMRSFLRWLHIDAASILMPSSFVSSLFPCLRPQAEWFVRIVVELLGTGFGRCRPMLQGVYPLMDLINRRHFLFFNTPSLRFSW